MTQATDTDIRDIKDLTVGLDSTITTIVKDATAELKVSLAGLDTWTLDIFRCNKSENVQSPKVLQLLRRSGNGRKLKVIFL
jgi:hypothetical protein